MLKRIKYTFVTVALAAAISSFVTPDKHVEKVAKKVWKGEDINFLLIELPDTLAVAIPCFNRISINEKVVGYACFSTAFGCRIGGCSSAGSSPNAQSYETFDYVVVYDSELSIRKVEIVNFGGEYGYEICRPKWLKQFQGSNSGFKLDENIDGITGATVSATYLIDDLNNLGKIVQRLKSEEIL